MKEPYIKIPIKKFIENTNPKIFKVSLIRSRNVYIFLVVEDDTLFNTLSKCTILPFAKHNAGSYYPADKYNFTIITIIKNCNQIFDYIEPSDFNYEPESKDNPYIDSIKFVPNTKLREENIIDDLLFSNNDKEIETWLKITLC